MKRNNFFKKQTLNRNEDYELNKKEAAEYKVLLKRIYEKDFDHNISKNRFRHLIYSNCFYCGNPPKEDSKGLVRNGIDRMDNSKGYTDDNVVSCCSTCNYMKKSMEPEEFFNHCSRIAKTSKERLLHIRNLGKSSIEFKVYMFKFGKYLSPNEIFKAISEGLLSKEDIKYDFKIAVKESKLDFTIVKNQLKSLGLKTKRLSKKVYDNLQVKMWNELKDKDNFIEVEVSQMSELVKICKGVK